MQPLLLASISEDLGNKLSDPQTTAAIVDRSEPFANWSTIEPSGRVVWASAWLAPLLLAVPWLIAFHKLSDPDCLQGLSGMVLVLVLAVSVVTDLRGRRIRNWTTYPALTYAVLINAGRTLSVCGDSPYWQAVFGGIGIANCLTGAVLCFSGTFCLFLLFGGGAGDVKLMMVLGALCGWRDGFQIWFCAMLLGSAFAIAHTVFKVGLRPLLGFILPKLGLGGQSLAARWKCRDSGQTAAALKYRMPLAPCFAGATFVVMGLPVRNPGLTVFTLLFG